MRSVTCRGRGFSLQGNAQDHRRPPSPGPGRAIPVHQRAPGEPYVAGAGGCHTWTVNSSRRCIFADGPGD